jgi:hypothetical protein
MAAFVRRSLLVGTIIRDVKHRRDNQMDWVLGAGLRVMVLLVQDLVSRLLVSGVFDLGSGWTPML